MAYDKPYESKPNTGILNSSKSKKTESSPDYFGDLTLDISRLGLTNGKGKVKIFGRKKVSKMGNTYLELSLVAIEEQQDFPKPVQREPQNNIEEDDIPF